jgi:isopentenyldiphosphate isomerase
MAWNHSPSRPVSGKLLGITLSCDKGRFRSWINREIKGSSGPNSSPVCKILLQRRSSSNKIFSNCWDSSSSFHVTFGESYEEAARRELKEETGLSVPLKYLGKFSYHVPPENEIVAVFSCRSDDPVIIDRAESSEASFYARDEVSAIAESEVAAPWLLKGWSVFIDSTAPHSCGR